MNRSSAEAFEAQVRAAVLECHRLGYYPSDFEGMLRNASAVQVAERLVTSGEIQSGLSKVVKMGHPELAIESIMLRPEFFTLFSDALREAARWRIKQAMSP